MLRREQFQMGENYEVSAILLKKKLFSYIIASKHHIDAYLYHCMVKAAIQAYNIIYINWSVKDLLPKTML